jgi:excisionase family DNA binding protein
MKNLFCIRILSLYSKPEAAQHLMVSERTVDRERAKGLLKWVQIGQRVCFNVADLDEYIRNQTLCGSRT